MNEEDLELLTRMLEKVDEIGDCLIWNGAVTSTGHPQIKVWGCGCKLARREMFRIVKGNLTPRIPIATKCDERGCINPDHLVESTISAISRKAAKRGAWKSMTRSAKIAAKKRAKGKLTMEQAREIRMSSESGPVLALRYGVNKSLVNGIKAGRNWKDYSNPFQQLMGLAA
jgi:hypothetical protein